VCVTISNPLIGAFFGYEGKFFEVAIHPTRGGA